MSRVFTILLLAITLLVSCVKNNIPYPIVELSISGVDGDGFSVGEIDYTNRVVYLDLEEQTDIKNVTINDITTTSGAEIIGEVVGVHDMSSSPIYLTLSMYQDYDWSIEARQDIELIFSVEGQVGEPVFESLSSTIMKATAYISTSSDLSNVTITDLKLAADEISSYTPDYTTLKDFSQSFRSVYVTTHGRQTQWRLYINYSDITVEMSRCDLWARIAWLEAVADTSSGDDYGFRYRKTGDEDWIEVDPSLIETKSGGFTARAEGFTPDTSYQIVAYRGDDVTDIVELTSGVESQLPNSGMEEWWQNGSPWYPYLSSEDAFWDTGNPGSTTLGSSYNLTTPSTDMHSGVYAAELKSRNVLVKFAAGNLFIGEYKSVVGVSDGAIALGRPFTSHPVALKFYVKYNRGIIDKIGSTPQGVDIVSGVTPDTGIIYVALGSWTAEKYGVSEKLTEANYGTDEVPHIVVTSDLDNTIFNPSGEDVSAYGEVLFEESITEWQEVVIPLEYVDTSLNHTHIILVASASRYGDYFTGSTDSVMYLDDFELLYE
ncbi:MAG: PCMD domain-containing protein [Rikenellaceae bacterium]